ncbi:MAG: TIGR01777 family oxidoreductase [Chthoniobacteraceae bacterium]
MRIAITGATGFLGRPITQYLHSIGWECVAISRNPAQAEVPGASRVVSYDGLPECDAVLHLAGESVVGLWTPAKRRAILRSREESTRALIARMRALPRPPRVFLCASAVGWYGNRPGEILTEDSTPDPSRAFRWKVCDAWERAASEAEALGCRVVHLRISHVLDPRGGYLGGLLPVYSRFGCWVLGNPQAALSWIGMEDYVRMVGFALESEAIRGPLNVATPNAITQRALTGGLAQRLGKPVRGRIPAPLLRGALGEFSRAILDDQRVVPAKAEALGFRWAFPAWRGWLQEGFVAAGR